MDRPSERDAVDRLIEAVRTGQSRALVMRGDPGVRITALLGYLGGRVADAGMPGGARGGRAVGDGGTPGCWQRFHGVVRRVKMHTRPGELAADGSDGPAAGREPVPAMSQRR
jgi:hypothetical protein